MIKLPDEYEKRMRELLGENYPLYEAQLSKPPVRAFRVNTDKISLDDFQKINTFGCEKVPYTDSAFYLTDEKAGSHPLHRAGAFYIQEPAAMMPVECIDIDPSWTVLDMCAAPGGKSTQVKNKLKDGILVSNEIISSRCKILTGNIERLGLDNTVTTCMDTKRLSEVFPGVFDLIICDAPCSGEGMFRKEEAAIPEWSTDNVIRCAERQREILGNAVKCLKDGGCIIYATCTFSLEENEKTIDEFLSAHPDFEIVKVNDRVKKYTSDGIVFPGCRNKDISFARRFYPFIAPGEGQFAAVLHNKNTYVPERRKKAEQPRRPPEIVYDFLSSVLLSYDKDRVIMNNSVPVYFRSDFPVKKGTAFSCGITIGEIKKNIIKPHHQFFTAMGKYFRNKAELMPDSEELKKYLHGEEFTLPGLPDGWACVTVGGVSLGGIKVNKGVCKNHYPKGLRTK